MTPYEIKEYAKCAQDPVYFLNIYGYALNIQSKPVRVDRITGFTYQNDILRKYQKYQNNIVLKSRQTGMSVITAAYVAWTLCFKSDQKILIVANDRNGAVRFLSTVKQFLEFVPAFLKPAIKLKDNETEIWFGRKNKEGTIVPDNKVQAVAAGPNAGRGEALSMLILDEAAFIDNAESIWMAASLALSGTKGKCIMISTPFGTGTLYHKTWQGAMETDEDKKNDFVPTQIHWTEHPIYSGNMSWKVDAISGLKSPTSPWYEHQCEQLNFDRVKIAQELDLSFEGSRALVIDSYIIQKYYDNLIGKDEFGREKDKPLYYYNWRNTSSKMDDRFISVDLNETTTFWVWKKPKRSEDGVLFGNYIVAADVARSDGEDYSTIQVIDADTCEQVAEFRDKIPPDLFAQVIYRIATDYNKAFAVVECNSFGLATSLALKNQLRYDVTRIYHSQSIKKLINPHFNVRVDEGEEMPGFQTTPATRILIVSALHQYMREGNIKINSKRLLNEFKTFIYHQSTGKPQHAQGAHDDLIFALGIALVIRDQEFKNVFLGKQYYKAMLDAFSFDNSNKSPTQQSVADDFEDKAREQYKIPIISKPYTGDDDLRWLMGPIKG